MFAILHFSGVEGNYISDAEVLSNIDDYESTVVNTFSSHQSAVEYFRDIEVEGESLYDDGGFYLLVEVKAFTTTEVKTKHVFLTK